MNRIDRLFGITTMLQSKKYVTAEKISEKFKISVRTVYRDIKSLCEQGIPVSFEQHKGYYIVQGYFLPPVSFSSEEANAVLLMESIVSAFADQSILTHYSSALNKIKSVLRGPEKDKLDLLQDKIKMHIPECFRSNFEYLSALQEAISAKTVISIQYTRKDGQTSTRRMEPIGLVFYALAWHLIGWCHLRNDYRDFKVPRIEKLSDTGVPFKNAKHITLEEYMQSIAASYAT